MATPIAAANAYSSLARLTDPGQGVGQGVGKLVSDPAGQPDFGAMLKDAVGAALEAGRKSDTQTQAMAAGKANVVDVVTAVAESETAVEALVAVRDRVIQAYEEIMRMPI
jgi:flagellar hook-basal body complex protein FliE